MRVYSLVLLYFLTSAGGLTEGRRVRRSVCEHGTYQHEGETCCFCQIGYRVINDCTDRNQTQCELCEEGTYVDHPNNDHQCQPCKICDPEINMEVKDRCSRYSNTICRCNKDHYCDKGDHCKACYPCAKCEEHGVKEKCTETKNAVCYDTSVPAGAITAAVLVSLILVIGVLLLIYLRRKKKFCFKHSPITDKKMKLNNLTDVDEDVDLTPFLPDIAETMGWKTAKRFSLKSGMTKANVEDREINSDVKDRTYELLNDWYQKQGLDGAYPALMTTLSNMNENKTADEIRKLVEKQQATAQP